MPTERVRHIAGSEKSHSTCNLTNNSQLTKVVICLSFYVLFLIVFYLCAVAIQDYDRKFQINTYLLTYSQCNQSTDDKQLYTNYKPVITNKYCLNS